MSSALVGLPQRQSSIRLNDGRTLAWSEWGPPTGRPLIFCTGAGMSGRLGFGLHEAHYYGVRLISVDRPGLGRSTYDPAKTFMSWNTDIDELIDQLDLVNPLALGLSQGAPFALSLAHSRLVRAVTVVSGQDELGYSQFATRLDPDVELLRSKIEANPVGMENHVATTATADWLWSMISQMSAPIDLSVYGSEPFASLYRQSLMEGFSQGASGYARDLILAMNRWEFNVSEISCPVHLWYGELDTSPVHSPDFGQTMSQRVSNCKRTIIEDGGSAIIWSHANEILRQLLDA